MIHISLKTIYSNTKNQLTGIVLYNPAYNFQEEI